MAATSSDKVPPVASDSEMLNQNSNIENSLAESGDDSCTPVQSDNPTGLSKKQLRKLRKAQKWEDNKLKKRADERARKKERRKVAREQGLELAPSRKSLKRITMAGSSCHQRVVVDCSFDDLMSDKDITNIVRQINHCYAKNRRTQNPVQFYVTGVEKKMKARLDSLKDSKFWDVHFSGGSYLDVFTKSELVYLSSDSDNILDTLDDQKVYVIGGLIDHNHHKGLCLKLANERGLSHARLPITDYVQFTSRKVLTVNQVFEILVGYTEKQDWEYAFLKAIPKRKDATAKRTAATEGEYSNSSGENIKKRVTTLCYSNTNNEEMELKSAGDSTGSRSESDVEGACVTSQDKNEGACVTSQDKNEGACVFLQDNNGGACVTSQDNEEGTCDISQDSVSVNVTDNSELPVT